MKKKLLFGNNISNLGKVLSKNFSFFNFQVAYCGNAYSHIMRNLEKNFYDGVFFFVNSETDELYSFMENVRRKFPEVKIYPILCRNCASLAENLLAYGAEQCFILPLTPEHLCLSIVYDFFDVDELTVSVEIAEFLVEHNFPTHVKGFYFLCLCIEKVIDDPDSYDNFSKILYPYVRSKTGSSEMWIERAVRNLSNMVYKDGVFFDGYPDEKNLSNKVLVFALTKEYCRINNIKRKIG